MDPRLLYIRQRLRRKSGASGSWTVDATSGKAVPADADEWSAFIAANTLTIAAPSSLWLLQEATGDAADSIGSLTLTANATPAYQQSVAGWTRKGVKGDGSTNNQRFRNTSAPNPSTTSMAMFAYVALHSADGTARTLFGFGAISDTTVSALLSTTGRIRYRESANIVDTDVANDYRGRVTPILLLVNQTASTARLFTDLEKLSPTFGDPSTATAVFIGGDSGTWADSTILYSCLWSGADAEMSDAEVKALFQALGYTIAWS